jgi:phosphatidylethanolamine-binding protein (PEBP) family uncharacterized protein
MVGNIRGSDLSTGDLLCEYLQPFPPSGTGYHRYAFVLYKQEARIDFAKEKRTQEQSLVVFSFLYHFQCQGCVKTKLPIAIGVRYSA